MITITKKEHEDYIKPLISKIEYALIRLNLSESVLIKDYFERIIKSEFEYEKLLKTLKEATPLKKQIMEKYGITKELENAISFLQKQPSD